VVDLPLETLNRLVREAFEGAQESLTRIEEAAQEDDRPVLHALSHAYARLLSPLRDYMASANMNRPLPRQLAKRAAEPLDAIFENEEEVRRLGLQPDPAALTRLLKEAETAT
jgi:hypothetical protein